MIIKNPKGAKLKKGEMVFKLSRFLAFLDDIQPLGLAKQAEFIFSKFPRQESSRVQAEVEKAILAHLDLDFAQKCLFYDLFESLDQTDFDFTLFEGKKRSSKKKVQVVVEEEEEEEDDEEDDPSDLAKIKQMRELVHKEKEKAQRKEALAEAWEEAVAL